MEETSVVCGQSKPEEDESITLSWSQCQLETANINMLNQFPAANRFNIVLCKDATIAVFLMLALIQVLIIVEWDHLIQSFIADGVCYQTPLLSLFLCKHTYHLFSMMLLHHMEIEKWAAANSFITHNHTDQIVSLTRFCYRCDRLC